MRKLLIGLSLMVAIAACAPSAPNDGEQYFDTITPAPDALDTSGAAAGNDEMPKVPDTVAAAGDANATTSEGLSDTDNFARLKERETIESDAAKLAALKENYEVVQPDAVPTRAGSANLASFALSHKNEVGNKIYKRNSFTAGKCRSYRTDQDAAQRAFLDAGGPEKDKLGLDRNGDGYACDWDPTVYRGLVQN